ncbi:MAG: hypothetical protein IPJ98_03655 [Bryobacterales bacterium]|nr:hypothetical protein [Bryobacterales bacterium]
MIRSHGLLLTIVVLAGESLGAQTGSGAEPIRYLGGIYVDQEVHDGRLRPAVGAASYQVMRANRAHPELGDGFGWTYGHAPMLAYWNGRFYLEYLSNPIGEHEPPGQTLIVTSTDGRRWSMPVVAFPPYKPPQGVEAPLAPNSTGYMMHQRMGFYVAPNGRLLALAFYGHAPNPFRTGGIGRVVREIYRDGNMGPIYFVRYNKGTPWNETNTSFPPYTRSDDREFKSAVESLLGNPMMVEQWRDEDPEASAIRGVCSSPSFFHRLDGVVTGVCKGASTTTTPDNGKTWTDAVRASTLITNNAKVWGQRTSDGRYALVYNPVRFGSHRWPLAITTGTDGIIFDTLNVVNGEVPPRRFLGRAKDFGPQYIRGIGEGNGDPGDQALWVTYSVNKEDIWVSRIPVPVRDTVSGPVDDNFDSLKAGGEVTDWNIYSPKWAPVEVVERPGGGKSLELRDKDPYDYARAVRVFPQVKAATLRFEVLPKSGGADPFEVEVLDRHGNRPVRIVFSTDGWIRAMNGSTQAQAARYSAGKWSVLEIDLDAGKGTYALRIDGSLAVSNGAFAEAVRSIERISFRTGPYRNEPSRQLDRYDPRLKDLPGADEPVAESVHHVDNLAVRTR